MHHAGMARAIVEQRSTSAPAWLEVPRDFPVAGHSHGGRSATDQIGLDVADLRGSVCRDTDALWVGLGNRSPESKFIDLTTRIMVRII